MSSTTRPSRALSIGSTLTSIAGLFPLAVSLYLLLNLASSVGNPEAPFSGDQLTGPSPYSLDEIAAMNPTLAVNHVLGLHVGYVNVANTGAVVLVLSFFGLRRGARWAWFTLLAVFLWVGVNDAIAFHRASQPPLPLVAETFGLLGLGFAYRPIFGHNPPGGR
jgi:hypothetical protein